MTPYKVFALVRDANWSQIGPDTVDARSSRSAIQEALKGRADVDGYEAFVAVPARSWRPVTVKVETKTALKFS